MLTYDHISIIYNPKSTGGSKLLAKDFSKQAKLFFPEARLELLPTEFVRHGEELAANLVTKYAGQRLLVVSSSGDGGYNEVINGVMDAIQPDQKVVCAVLPAGNANDHSRTMHQVSLVDNLSQAVEKDIDLLKVRISDSKNSSIRYAHSYAGLGFTPVIGAALNEYDLNPIKEKIIAAKAFRDLKPVKILHNKKVLLVDSIVFSNINQMAKVLSFSSKNKPDDGKFEVTVFEHDTKPKLLLKIAKAAVSSATPQKRAKRYQFATLHKVSMQLDGEVISMAKDSQVTITIVHHALKTLVC